MRHPDTSKLSFGKVTAVNGDVVHFIEFMRPEDLPGGRRLSYHSKFELIRTETATKEFTKNIVRSI